MPDAQKKEEEEQEAARAPVRAPHGVIISLEDRRRRRRPDVFRRVQEPRPTSAALIRPRRRRRRRRLKHYKSPFRGNRLHAAASAASAASSAARSSLVLVPISVLRRRHSPSRPVARPNSSARLRGPGRRRGCLERGYQRIEGALGRASQHYQTHSVARIHLSTLRPLLLLFFPLNE